MASAIPRSVISLNPDIGSLVAAPNAKLLQDVGNVGLNGVHGDHELARDLLVCPPVRNETQDVLFPPRESADVRNHVNAPGTILAVPVMRRQDDVHARNACRRSPQLPAPSRWRGAGTLGQ